MPVEFLDKLFAVIFNQAWLPLICTTSSLGMRTKHPLCVVN